MTVTAADILERAAVVLEIGGHCRDDWGPIGRDDAPHCEEGALFRAAKTLRATQHDKIRAFRAVSDELGSRFGDRCITNINDDPSFRMGVKRWAALNRRVAKQLREQT